MINRFRSIEDSISAVSPSTLAAFFAKNGYVVRGKWGTWLERYSKRTGGKELNILLPVSTEISDYNAVVYEAISSYSTQSKTPINVVLSSLLSAGYGVFRIRAFDGTEAATISYSAALRILQEGIKMVEESVAAVEINRNTEIENSAVRSVVQRYADEVKLGQTEAGSYILTFLLPLEADFLLTEKGSIVPLGVDVTSALANSLDTIGKALSLENPEVAYFDYHHGISDRFAESVERMLTTAGDLTFSIANPYAKRRSDRDFSTKLSYSDVDSLRNIRTSHSVPILRDYRTDVLTRTSLVGRVISIDEDARSGAGKVKVQSSTFGKVRVDYTVEYRDIVIRAFEEKAQSDLSVFGDLKMAPGPKQLLGPQGFKLVTRRDMF